MNIQKIKLLAIKRVSNKVEKRIANKTTRNNV